MSVPELRAMEEVLNLFGVDVKPLPADLPARVSNFELAPLCPVSAAFREEMQHWLDDFFGTHEVCYVISGKVFLGPDAMRKMGVAKLMVYPSPALDALEGK